MKRSHIINKIILSTLSVLFLGSLFTFRSILKDDNTPVSAWSGPQTSNEGNYFASVGQETGETLKNKLKSIISVGTSESYDWSRYEAADEAEGQSNSVLLIYSRQVVLKTAHISGSTGWNREHSFAKSLFNEAAPAVNDNHHIFADDNKTNSVRGNNPFNELNKSTSTRVVDGYGNLTDNYTSGSYFMPNDLAKGEVARATMYMNTRYGYSITLNFYSIALMLRWHIEHPVTNREIYRNNVVHNLQGNRNPFIDHQDYACRIWSQTNSETQSLCSGQSTNVPVTSVSVSPSSGTINLASTNKTLQLTANVLPATATNPLVSWSSSNGNVASVSNNGFVTALGVGQTTITATSLENNTIKGTATINVTNTPVVIGEEELIYSTGFESSDGFTATTVYNNSTVAYSGPSGKEWGTYYGTPSTTSPLSGGQSMQMRWYTSSTSNLGYTYTNFSLQNVTKVNFKAQSSDAGINVSVAYSTDNGNSWVGDETFNLDTSTSNHTYNVSATGEYANVRLRFALSYASTPSSTSRLYIDDVEVYGKSEVVKTLSSISYTGTLNKTTYNDGENFDPSGLSFRANYSDSSSRTLTYNELTFTPSPLSIGNTTVTASYSEGGIMKTTSISGLTVFAAPSLNTLTLSGSLTKNTYTTIESWSAGGLNVTGHYTDSSSQNVTSLVSWSFNPLSPQEGVTNVTITATYDGKSVSNSYAVNVTSTTTTNMTRVSTVNALAYGAIYTIGAQTSSSGFVMTTAVVDDYFTSGNATYLNNDTELEITTDIMQFSLEIGYDANTFAFKLVNSANDGKYISYNGTSNALYTSETLDSNSSWIISIDGSGKATISNSALSTRKIQYNNMNPRFAAYTSSLVLPSLYVNGATVDPTTSATRLVDAINNGRGASAKDNCAVVLNVLNNAYSQLSPSARGVFDTSNDSAFISARNRMAYLNAWVASNSGTSGMQYIESKLDNTFSIILISAIGLISLIGFYYVKRRKAMI